jgi:hypothetical protein
MAKSQFLSKHQQGIVNRYYQHADTRVLTKLQELVSEIYLATDPKSLDKLWKSAKTQLENTPMPGGKIDTLIASRDIKALAESVAALSKK